jgi:hypothetical protein
VRRIKTSGGEGNTVCLLLKPVDRLARLPVRRTDEDRVLHFTCSVFAGSFRVADLSFDVLERSCGFTGRFNATGAAPGLRDGLRVRLAHREGFILRVEVAP